ncbi:PadR family transcriptional regulator [Levilactobacillus bambusae]|uniref:PadR family transcriptional regulator n=1 Tax=Levilactobacillus bambusae TaxID=2024736 RepID=A0A2V1MX54_9LACO|nr:PadR family transcriptional regulator [Levilactobacillus bambusae]PWF99653.1 PadR family transcriptional regulator [Levilactobacillus bambusae]
MYEIVILGELLENNKSGYKLGLILNNILGPGRKISNGTLHPLLVRLGKEGDLTWQVDPKSTRGKKNAQITPQGAEHFQALMREPVPENARRDETYRFKIAELRQVDPEVQLQILQDFRSVTQSEYDAYAEHREHVLKLPNKPADEIAWTATSFDLYLNIATTKLTWIDNQIHQLTMKGSH